MERLRKFYEYIIFLGTNFKHLLLLMIRLYWGLLFCFAGWGKLNNFQHTVDFFQSLHIPIPNINAFLAASTEFFGGFCLAIGFASRLISLPLIFTMLVAYLTAHSEAVKTIISNPENFVSQGPFNFLLACLIVFSCGPGAFSIDAAIKRTFEKKIY